MRFILSIAWLAGVETGGLVRNVLSLYARRRAWPHRQRHPGTLAGMVVWVRATRLGSLLQLGHRLLVWQANELAVAELPGTGLVPGHQILGCGSLVLGETDR